MDQEENLDLLDLEQDNEVDALPEATPFSVPRPKKPWLLMGLGLVVIVLATWIIIARVGGDSASVVTVDLDAPVVEQVAPQPEPDLKVPPKPVEVVKPEVKPVPAPAPKPVPVAKPVENDGTPIRVVEDRKEVTFNPDKPSIKPAAKAQPKPAAKPASKPAANTSKNAVYVQFGSYSERSYAQAAEQKMRKAHPTLFSGKQFVILAAEVKGSTLYRLRIAFNSANEANGFCRNAKSDGVDCYVTK